MISYDDAVATVLANVPAPEEITLPIEKAVGLILADDIISPIDVCPFRNSAMDGFAVNSDGLSGCSQQQPVTLPVVGTIFAGDNSALDLTNSRAVKIMTGAPVPDRFDAVVKFEDTIFSDRCVTIRTPVSRGDNVRPAGEDIRQGERVFLAGRQIGPLDTGILASVGLSHVRVRPRARVLLVTTGDEVKDPGGPLPFGSVYNANRYSITALIEKHCHSLDVTSVISDNLAAIEEILNKKNVDIIVTTGGVSAGEKDFIPQVAETAGWTTLFHKVAIKPGKPVYFARRERQLLFGLPGNPLSAVVTCALFLLPALRAFAGKTPATVAAGPAQIDGDPRKTGRTLFWPGNFRQANDSVHVSFSEKRSSAALTAVKDTDGIIIQPPWSNELAPPRGVEFVSWRELLG